MSLPSFTSFTCPSTFSELACGSQHVTGPGPCRHTQPPPIINEEGEEEWEIEKIEARRKDGKFLVRWKGYIDTTWEPLKHVKDTAALEEFLKAEKRETTKRGRKMVRVITPQEENSQ